MAEQQNVKQQNAKEPDLNQLLKVRREKLAELQAAGKDPFQITKYDVTVHSEDVKADYAEWEGKDPIGTADLEWIFARNCEYRTVTYR